MNELSNSRELPLQRMTGGGGPQEEGGAPPGTHESARGPRVPPPVARAEGLLRWLDQGWLHIDHLVQHFIPPALNPFGQLGAIANMALIIAILSGIAMLVWYTPSVNQAYASLDSIRMNSWLGQWVRSLHRYSSDGCLFFILLHAARIVTQCRFTGARWLAWTTGILMLAAIWFIGWTGYWLVWDVRAQHAALGTARFIDCLPIFAEPMSRSFLTDASVPSLLFFLIFFLHMVLPLGVGIGIWMHLMRVNRARFLTGRAMTVWVAGSLAALSAVLPAVSGAPAMMTVKAQKFTIDWWYLWPLQLTDRIGGGVLWAIFLFGGIVALAVPWWMARGRPAPEWKAQVDLARCFGCTLCAKDCPFDAITMIPREDGKRFDVQSHVNPALCVSCGICTGACDSEAINLSAFNSREVGKELAAWLGREKTRGVKPFVAFCCGKSAGDSLRADPGGRSAELPGYRVVSVPCVGWVSAGMLERTLQQGAAGVLVVGCGETEPPAREGMKWFEERLAGRRQPAFDPGKADLSRVRYVRLDRTRAGELIREARNFQTPPAEVSAPARRAPAMRIAAPAALALVLAIVTHGLSNLAYRTPHSSEPELVVSFNHHGALVEARELTAEELANRLPHMRAQVNVTRERHPVRMRVQLDNRVVLDQSYRAKGLSKDGPSIAMVRLPAAPGAHGVTVELADTADPGRWTQSWHGVVEFQANHIRVVLFDSKGGFSLH